MITDRNIFMLTKEKIDRINELAKKSKCEGLTIEEIEEQKILRAEYIAGYRRGFIHAVESVVIVDEEGNSRKIEKKEK